MKYIPQKSDAFIKIVVVIAIIHHDYWVKGMAKKRVLTNSQLSNSPDNPI